ncbi:MAG: hypothetical protein WA863_16995 [Methyloceanibacter sp.]
MTIVEVPKPPRGRLPFLRLLARLVSNPVASWGEDFYDAPIVVYRDLGLQTLFVPDPELIQQSLLDDSDCPHQEHTLRQCPLPRRRQGVAHRRSLRRALAKAHRRAAVSS